MGKLSIGQVLNCIRRSSSSGLGYISNYISFKKHVDKVENKPLIASSGYLVKLKDVSSQSGGPYTHNTLALHSKPPKVLVLKVSMHCNGCARQVKKHVSKLEGVISCKVDLETKRVVVTGDVIPLHVLESLSKIKTAQLWDTHIDDINAN